MLGRLHLHRRGLADTGGLTAQIQRHFSVLQTVIRKADAVTPPEVARLPAPQPLRKHRWVPRRLRIEILIALAAVVRRRHITVELVVVAAARHVAQAHATPRNLHLAATRAEITLARNSLLLLKTAVLPHHHDLVAVVFDEVLGRLLLVHLAAVVHHVVAVRLRSLTQSVVVEAELEWGDWCTTTAVKILSWLSAGTQLRSAAISIMQV